MDKIFRQKVNKQTKQKKLLILSKYNGKSRRSIRIDENRISCYSFICDIIWFIPCVLCSLFVTFQFPVNYIAAGYIFGFHSLLINIISTEIHLTHKYEQCSLRTQTDFWLLFHPIPRLSLSTVFLCHWDKDPGCGWLPEGGKKCIIFWLLLWPTLWVSKPRAVTKNCPLCWGSNSNFSDKECCIIFTVSKI